MTRRRLLAAAAAVALLTPHPAPAFGPAEAAVVRALGGRCYWQAERTLTPSALAFRDELQRVLGFDLFRDCVVREQRRGSTTIDCSARAPENAATVWTLTMRVGFPGGLDTWQACIDTIVRDHREVVYEASLLARYRAPIAGGLALYGLLVLVRRLRRGGVRGARADGGIGAARPPVRGPRG